MSHEAGYWMGTTMIGMVVLMVILVTWKLGLWFWAFAAAAIVALLVASFITGYATLTAGAWASRGVSWLTS